MLGMIQQAISPATTTQVPAIHLLCFSNRPAGLEGGSDALGGTRTAKSHSVLQQRGSGRAGEKETLVI